MTMMIAVANSTILWSMVAVNILFFIWIGWATR